MRNMLTRCRRRKEPNAARPDRCVIGWPGQWAGRSPRVWKLDPDSALLADQNTLEWSIRHRGPGSATTLNAKGQVAVRLEQLGRYDEALQLRAEVTGYLRSHLGTEHVSTLTAGRTAGFRPGPTWSAWRSSASVRTRCRWSDRRVGSESPATLLAMDWLGCTLRSIGNLPESRRLFEDAVDRYEKSGGGETEECLTTTAHLASTLFQLDRLSEACELRRHILDVRNRTLGPDDPVTLNSFERLANALQWIHELDEARVIYENLLARRVRLLGADHPDALRTKELLVSMDRDLETGP